MKLQSHNHSAISNRFSQAHWRDLIELMRWHRPIGIWLLLWPCLWAVALASPAQPDAGIIACFVIGSIAIRSAGCIMNDWADKSIDRQVARTKHRPLAAGRVSDYQAACLLLSCLTTGLIVLLALPQMLLPASIICLILIAAYPFMKRLINCPQCFLGLCFNSGALFGWVAVRGTIELPALLLYAGSICWTIGYDTLYAHQDITDDKRIGVRSSAIWFGRYNRVMIALCYAAFIGLLTCASFLTRLTWWHGAALGIAALLCAWQVYQFREADAKRSAKLFRLNQWVGLVIASGWIVGLRI